jgi:membrane-bound lytic murein transglycosylase D
VERQFFWIEIRLTNAVEPNFYNTISHLMLLQIYQVREFCSLPKVAAKVRLNRLGVAISVATLLNACSVVQDSSPLVTAEAGRVHSPASDSQQAVTARSGSPRERIPSGIGESAEIVNQYQNIWARISDGLSFSLEHDNVRIEEQIAFYSENPAFLATVTERARPFIFEIVEELEKRSLPMELALLPIVESAYNPNATAGRNTAGLWQIISSTARSLGIKQDWWYDGRRDPIASTSAALDYLSTLNEAFGNDWLLALAAYNTGQGNVQKAIDQNQRRSRSVDYWSLNLSSTTKEFVPKLIALARLISAPDQYGLELADVHNERVVALIDAGTQIDLALVAEVAGVEPAILYQLNPGIRQWATHPDGPHTLLVPVNQVELFKSAVASLEGQTPVTWDRYVVQSGDTLSKIARQFNTQIAALQQVNGIEGSRIIAGESLLIPRAYNSSAPIISPNAPEYQTGLALTGEVPPQGFTPPTRYEVRSGDSLWRIAGRYNLSASTLAEWNNISTESILRPGQVLMFHSDPAVSQSTDNSSGNDTINYTVKSGDTLARIAKRFGVGVAKLIEWNDIQAENLIHPGQQLLLRPERSVIN